MGRRELVAALAVPVGVAVVYLIMKDQIESSASSPASGMDLPLEARIRLHRGVAQAVAARNGVPAFADWAVGQAGAESSYGHSHVYELTNNPFGIKAGSWLKGVDAAGNPIVNKPGQRVVKVEAHDGVNWYRAFPTLEAAYQHLLELYRDYGIKAYEAAWPLLVAGQYQAFADKVGPVYEPARPASGPDSYAQLVLDSIAAAQEIS